MSGLASIYHRFLYRPHMRVVHKLGGHGWETIGPIFGSGNDPRDGQGFDRCTWCGAVRHDEAFRSAVASAMARGWTLDGGWPTDEPTP